ncbi:intermembrane lipid transfer protein VPS13D-like [Geothlypis trichas]
MAGRKCPVSVDKVGTFFRYAAPDKNSSSSTLGSPISRTNIIHPQVYFSSLPPVRVVFEVSMEGSARKVITVRSALMLKNKLEIPMELRLDSPSAPDKPVVLPAVMPGDSFAIPLHLTSWRLQARPKGMGFFFSKAPIHWTNVQKAAEVCSSKRECHSMESENRFFRFCVAIKKENYPDYMPSSIFSDSAKQIFRQPGHTIYLLPTVVICNLLPCELEFYVKGLPISGTLKPGKEAALHTADTAQNIELGVLLENFPICKELLIPPGTQNYMVRMRLYDANKRLLNLTIRIVCRAEGSLKILISAPYWLINKTGLPLIFRQDNAKQMQLVSLRNMSLLEASAHCCSVMLIKNSQTSGPGAAPRAPRPTRPAQDPLPATASPGGSPAPAASSGSGQRIAALVCSRQAPKAVGRQSAAGPQGSAPRPPPAPRPRRAQVPVGDEQQTPAAAGAAPLLDKHPGSPFSRCCSHMGGGGGGAPAQPFPAPAPPHRP